jgi:hypothetical protein
MSAAVENAVVVVICISRAYKESARELSHGGELRFAA